MDTEKAAIETGVVDGTVETFGYEPNQFHKDELIGLPYIEKLALKDSEDIEIYGSSEQRTEMFKDWSNYIGEIQNPINTAMNPAFVEKGGKLIPYAPLDEVLNNARPVLSKYGFGIIQVPTAPAGKVSVKTILTHKSGGFMSFPSFSLQTVRADAQSVISSLTYARRGSLNPLLATHGETDDDGNSLVNKDTKKPETTKPDVPEDLKTKQKLVCSVLKELIDVKKDDAKYKESIYTVVKNNCGVMNPNSVTDITLLDATYAALDKIRTEQKAGK